MTALSDTEIGRLLEAIGDDAIAPAPPELRERTLSEALAQRLPGSHIARPARSEASAAFEFQIRALQGLLPSLGPGDRNRPTDADYTIGELVAHLIGTEEYFGSLLGLWRVDVPDAARADHRATSQSAIQRHALTPLPEMIDRWNEVTEALLHALVNPELLPAEIVFHSVPLTLRSALVVRSFELWTHADDLRRALGQPLEAPPVEHLASMSSIAVRSTAAGLRLAGIDHDDRRIHVVLTGGGGGTSSLGFGSTPPADADTILVADAVDFCRMAAGRLDIADLPADITGDVDFAHDVCRAARVFAA